MALIAWGVEGQGKQQHSQHENAALSHWDDTCPAYVSRLIRIKPQGGEKRPRLRPIYSWSEKQKHIRE